jgi:hypothetical protein
MTSGEGQVATVRRTAGWTIALLAVAGGMGALSQWVWNPDGPNWFGLSLFYLSALFLVIALIYPWRRPRCFARLGLWSLVGIPVFAILHNVFYALGMLSENVPLLPVVFEGLHAAAFLVALLLCPAGVVVGLVGWIVTRWFGGRRAPGVRKR